MNRIWTAIAAIMLMMVFVVSCSKPDDPNNGGNNNGPNDSVVDDNGSVNGHDYVDLGLPSGTLWATCNVGADTPEGCGDYFAWGETEPKERYDWKCYKYGRFFNERYELSKYCTDSVYGFDGFVDNLTFLESNDDVANACWGAGWRMPTIEEWEELFLNTTGTWTTQNDVDGWCCTASNGNSLFLPAAGYWWGDAFNANLGLYWSSTLNPLYPYRALGFHFNTDSSHLCGSSDRNRGQSVRAVRSARRFSFFFCFFAMSNNKNRIAMNRTLKAIAAIMLMMVFAMGCNKPDEPNNGGNNDGQNDSIVDHSGTLNGHDYVDLGLPSGTLWATCNVGAEVPEDYGEYFAWGETEPKTTYDWSTYKYCEGEYDRLTKYCSDTACGYDGFTDNLYVLQPSDDAAAVIWGEGWRMPDGTEAMELLNECDHRWDSINGVGGLLVIGENGNTLFLPAAGLKGVYPWEEDFQTEFNQAGHSGQYWMRERGIAFNNYSTPDVEYMANEFYFPYGNNGGSRAERSRGLPIRPVCSAK